MSASVSSCDSYTEYSEFLTRRPMNGKFLRSFLIAAVILGAVTYFSGHDEVGAEAELSPVPTQSVIMTVHATPWI